MNLGILQNTRGQIQPVFEAGRVWFTPWSELHQPWGCCYLFWKLHILRIHFVAPDSKNQALFPRIFILTFSSYKVFFTWCFSGYVYYQTSAKVYGSLNENKCLLYRNLHYKNEFYIYGKQQLTPSNYIFQVNIIKLKVQREVPVYWCEPPQELSSLALLQIVLDPKHFALLQHKERGQEKWCGHPWM